MTTKMHRKLSSVLAGIAIAVLIAILIVVWMQVGHGTFKPKHSDHQNVTTTTEDYSSEFLEHRGPPDRGFTETKGPEVYVKRKDKEILKISHLDDLATADVEFIKPMKISPPPLHQNVIIHQDEQDQPPLRHHSGHFRHRTAEVWDSHPEYEIQAFGRKLDLELTLDAKFVSSNFQVTRVWNNYTQKALHDSKIRGCFYSGKVKGEKNSDVAVSLCNGMTGYIRTPEGSYYIEPIEKFQLNVVPASILHRIKKIPHSNTDTKSSSGSSNPSHRNEIIEESANPDLCETQERTSNAHHMDEALGATTHHVISKRALRFDYLDTSQEDDLIDFDKRRSTRHVPWNPWDSEDDSYEFIPKHVKTGNQEYYVEVLVVADRKMLEYHNTQDDLDHYILILMSHVASLFKDRTIGNPISLAVVKIVTLADMEFKAPTSMQMLHKFCAWQAKYNSYLEYDIALLLTRESICMNSTNCLTLGIAEVGSMCNHHMSCAIIKDKGLSTSYTIAHELGHLLSMPHDDDKRCTVHNGNNPSDNIMGKILQNSTKPWMWSPCSKYYLTEFLETSKASCLLNTPNNDFSASLISSFPGETYEVDQQCQLEFGAGYRLCPYVENRPCRYLWCTLDIDKGCRTNHVLWADGTPCGEQSWCHHGECIAQDRNLLQPVAGGWGKWQEWGACSRTCGGGVKAARRACDTPPPANGGSYCVGRSVKYSSCNAQACDPNAANFRELQCAEFNGDPKGLPDLNETVKWVADYGRTDPDDICKLYCRVKHTSSSYPLKEKVIDGTKCGLDTFGICVNGVCRPGGCDNSLDSKTTIDACGVCGGDNSKCEEISGTYNISQYGYNRVIRLPKGSANIYIQQRAYGHMSPDKNYLALVDGETGLYVLNGDDRISLNLKHFIFGGINITYSGSENVVEYIKSQENRTLAKDLALEVLSVGNLLPPDITYRYTIRRDSAPRYSWLVYDQQWSKCNSLCSGKQYLRPLCIYLTTRTHVPDSYCADLDMNSLVQQKDCNTHCKFQWNVQSRGQCSSHCGHGVRPIVYNCIRVELKQDAHEQTTKYQPAVSEKHCLSTPKPSEVEACQGRCDSTRWEYEEWSECTQTCGGGTRRRTYKCVDVNGQTLSTSQCNEGERITEQVCNTQKCPVWSFDEWSPCSVTCGKGYRKRPYFCHVDGRNYNPEACNREQLPVVEEECTERPCTLWSTGKWNKCSVSCGEGVQTREVHCLTHDYKTVEDHHCTGMLKPNSSRACVQDKCNELTPYKREYYNIITDFEDNSISQPHNLNYKWVTGAWAKCTKSCETGRKFRMVVCRNTYGEEDEQKCDSRQKPLQSVECNPHACPIWNFGAWSTCDSNCQQHRQVSCQNATGDIVPDTECDTGKKPYSSTKCNTNRCIRTAVTSNDYYRRNYYNKENREKQYKWKLGKWSECSKTCGRGTKTRLVRCVDVVYAATVVDQFCSHLRKPKPKRPCEKSNCDYIWLENLWSQCSATCGQGFKYRNVTCHRVLRGGFIDPAPLSDDSYCNIYNKPTNRASCTDSNCYDKFSWSTGPWSECSHPCGKKGRQIRSLYCLSRDGRKVNRRSCPINLKPKRRRKCNNKRCIYGSCKEIQRKQGTSANKDYYLLINERPAMVYCYKMDTRDPEEFITLKSEHGNFAEMYDKRLRVEDSCPYYGPNQDSCDCIPVSPDISGYTVFWKVRLNITSLQIIGDDYTFSNQMKGTKIKYGTAGDCYSNQERCTQGRFAIDLTDTSFRLSRNVRWIHNGSKASSHVDVQDRIVRGRCGGYCGSCSPDPMVGLAVEVT